MKRFLSILLSFLIIAQLLFAVTAFAGEKAQAPEVSGYCDLTSHPVVKWKKQGGANRYFIYRSNKKNGEYKLIGSNSKGSFTDKKAKLHKKYFYRVSAGKNGAKSRPVELKAMKTVFVGDSVMHGLVEYKTFPKGNYVTKIGVGAYSFYNGNRYSYKGRSVTGIDKLIYSKPDRVFIMLGMNELGYTNQKAIFKYYNYIIRDLKEARKGVEIVLLPVSPTTPYSDSSIPKKPKILKFNNSLKQFAAKRGCKYYDYTAPFKDKNGYLKKQYNAGDGCHWQPSSCKLFIKQIKKYVKAN